MSFNDWGFSYLLLQCIQSKVNIWSFYVGHTDRVVGTLQAKTTQNWYDGLGPVMNIQWASKGDLEKES